ncbi:MAG TPA: TIGR03560 family F420-dependent LLM class oxidoreductase [Anaerolineales bacterium]|nr:TIGR03560 family F420-dependent LLM class oxidoreductase [Anaerolineales bacterium]
MLEIAVMIEGQNGLTWPRWQRIARLVEDAGFVGLFRSDHFTNSNHPDIESLDLWPSLTWLASHTERIEFGPLVTPFSFRHPVHTARMSAAVDDLSGGRLVLGLGAGWNAREHHLFGFELLKPNARFNRLEEGLEVVTRLLQSDEPVTFEGEYYQLRGARLLPRPQRPGGPRILIGGNGIKRTLTYVVRYATEWNCVSLRPDDFARLNQRLTGMLTASGRAPDSARRSMMTGCVFGKDDVTLHQKIAARGSTLEKLHEHGTIAGSLDTVREQLAALEQAGLQRIMLQWLDLDDLESLEALAKGLLRP